jgi:ADP-ribosyl-[dinitrogen reductase] hydrolase
VRPSLEDRFAGSLLGLACGDAVGTAAEFAPRGAFEPIATMRGGGPFDLPPGCWTDDTSMALCLAASLLERSAFDAADQMTRYLRWYREGYQSSTGRCFDIGNTVRGALLRFAASGEPYAGSADPSAAGNGSLMRLAPVVLFFHGDAAAVVSHAIASSRTTHAAPEALECCALFARLIDNALAGRDPLAADPALYLEPRVRALAAGDYRGKRRDEVRGTGYCVAALEAALWCVATTASFEAAVLAAANLGDDADTTAAITGQLAGAHYGVAAIPHDWLETLHDAAGIGAIARALYAARARH